MQFPFTYIDLNYPEHDLFEISDADWNHDVDARQTIGPNQSDEQYSLDSNGKLFKVAYTGMDRDNVPEFKFELCDNPNKLREILEYINHRSG